MDPKDSVSNETDLYIYVKTTLPSNCSDSTAINALIFTAQITA